MPQAQFPGFEGSLNYWDALPIKKLATMPVPPFQKDILTALATCLIQNTLSSNLV